MVAEGFSPNPNVSSRLSPRSASDEQSFAPIELSILQHRNLDIFASLEVAEARITLKRRIRSRDETRVSTRRRVKNIITILNYRC